MTQPTSTAREGLLRFVHSDAGRASGIADQCGNIAVLHGYLGYIDSVGKWSGNPLNRIGL